MSKHNPKLSPEQKQKLMDWLNDGRIKQEWIAKQFGVNQSNVAYYNKKRKQKLHSEVNPSF